MNKNQEYREALESIDAWRPALDLIRIELPHQLVSYKDENIIEVNTEVAGELWAHLGDALGYTFGGAK